MENAIVSADKNKPVLDEKTLDKLLEAAYVVQEHNREMGAPDLPMDLKRDHVESEKRPAPKKAAKSAPSAKAVPPGNDTVTLAQIVETQHHIQVLQLALEDAMALVAERVVEVGRAGGAAIGIVEGANVHYRAMAGLMTPAKNATVPIAKSLCAPCVKTNQVFRCRDVNSEFSLDGEECRRRGIASMIAVPIRREGGVIGGLELYYSKPSAFTEQDVHSCQLMGGLITEAMARQEELTWKKSLASERAAMLEALEKLKPNLAALLGQPSTSDAAQGAASAPPQAVVQTCRKCGHQILGEEQFCGQCGLPRSSDYEPPNMQSKVASLWQMQQSRKNNSPRELPDEAEEHEEKEELPDDFTKLLSEASLGEPLEAEVPEASEPEEPVSRSKPSAFPVELFNTELETSFEEEAKLEEEEEKEEAEEPKAAAEITLEEPVALAKTAPVANWSSAASARAFLEQLASAKRAPSLIQFAPSLVRFWNNRRGDIYLVVAIILVACVIRWGIWSGHSVSATAAPKATAAAHQKSPEEGLSLFDRILIGLGVADPPETPEDKGNPTVQVWVDTHSALYYCPGADLYGKTPKGKFATQREAQLDQFQPAYRKACN